jgi:2-oxoisovalerate dehydrogenase E2 component (dihydrolipoyl transacylase)
MSTFRLPDLGEGLAEAEIREWHVKPGDQVVVDQPMVSVETAKAVVDVPVPFSGTVTALHGAVGDIVATGAPLIDLDAGTVVGSMPIVSEDHWAEPPDASPDASPDARPDASPAGSPLGSPAEARRRALPVARALATHLHLPLESVAGSGANGVVTVDDVLTHAAALRPAATGAAPSAASRLTAPRSLPHAHEPLRGARRAMAQSMSQSRAQVAGSTVCDDADIEGWTVHADYMLRLIRAMGHACAVEPALNAWYDGATQSRALRAQVDLAIAIDTAEGLIVPVLRNIRAQTTAQLRASLAAQKEAAHRRSTSVSDLRDFTVMLSNFGTLAGRYGIPLIVPPAVAILGAGKVRHEAVVVAGAVVAHRRMPLSLSFDHRCVSGGEACRFLAAVIADLEKPD